jgi:hypothetical protein
MSPHSSASEKNIGAVCLQKKNKHQKILPNTKYQTKNQKRNKNGQNTKHKYLSCGMLV